MHERCEKVRGYATEDKALASWAHSVMLGWMRVWGLKGELYDEQYEWCWSGHIIKKAIIFFNIYCANLKLT